MRLLLPGADQGSKTGLTLIKYALIRFLIGPYAILSINQNPNYSTYLLYLRFLSGS